MKHVLLGCALMLGAPAAAQEARQPPAPVTGTATPDPAALAEARQLLIESGFETQMEQAAMANAEATFNTVLSTAERQRGSTMPEDLKQSVRRIVMADIRALVADMKVDALDKAAAVYARYFAADEMRALRRLQNEPVMVKMRQVAPQFMTDLTQIGVQAAAERMPALEVELRQAVADWSTAQHGKPSRTTN
jgi:hypothetical protein